MVFERRLRVEDNLPGEGVDGLVTLVPVETRGRGALVPEPGGEDPLDRRRRALESLDMALDLTEIPRTVFRIVVPRNGQFSRSRSKMGRPSEYICLQRVEPGRFSPTVREFANDTCIDAKPRLHPFDIRCISGAERSPVRLTGDSGDL